MLKIGLTGGIGSGKSTVAGIFQQLGIPVIDADEIAHELVEPGKPVLEKLAAEFGPGILTHGGELDRKALRNLVFHDPRAKSKLEAIMHPAVFAEMKRQAEKIQAPYCIFAIPLLIETDSQALVDRILVVDCPERLQIERVKERDGLDESLIKRILATQATRQERIAQAHDLIVNTGDLSLLEKQVRDLHQNYLNLSRRRNDP